MLRFSFPVTAAGPPPIFTELPFMLLSEHLNYELLNGFDFYCKENCVNVHSYMKASGILQFYFRHYQYKKKYWRRKKHV